MMFCFRLRTCGFVDTTNALASYYGNDIQSLLNRNQNTVDKLADNMQYIYIYTTLPHNVDKPTYFTDLNSSHLGMIPLINHDSQ